MLEFNYSERFKSLIQSLDWRIQLPPSWANFFDERGDYYSLMGDERQNGRTRVRTQGVMIYEQPLPNIPRGLEPVGIYSRDFSRRACGFLTPYQLYPLESVRLILPTLWMRLQICRSRRLGPSCYEIGGELIDQSPPSESAFNRPLRI